ncbi:hypothetical protein, partial [Bradyrhizobium liaoningense]|uniref:hypothetical protein n=1 Tax=Bradyrhizobium liaoningense TaxID=43992 RepID=UPI001BADD8F9
RVTPQRRVFQGRDDLAHPRLPQRVVSMVTLRLERERPATVKNCPALWRRSAVGPASSSGVVSISDLQRECVARYIHGFHTESPFARAATEKVIIV